jgi:hypothetical protein
VGRTWDDDALRAAHLRGANYSSRLGAHSCRPSCSRWVGVQVDLPPRLRELREQHSGHTREHTQAATREYTTREHTRSCENGCASLHAVLDQRIREGVYVCVCVCVSAWGVGGRRHGW